MNPNTECFIIESSGEIVSLTLQDVENRVHKDKKNPIAFLLFHNSIIPTEYMWSLFGPFDQVYPVDLDSNTICYDITVAPFLGPRVDLGKIKLFSCSDIAKVVLKKTVHYLSDEDFNRAIEVIEHHENAHLYTKSSIVHRILMAIVELYQLNISLDDKLATAFKKHVENSWDHIAELIINMKENNITPTRKRIERILESKEAGISDNYYIFGLFGHSKPSTSELTPSDFEACFQF